MKAGHENSTEQRQSSGGLISIAGIIASLTAILIVILTSARASLEPLTFNAVFVLFSSTILALLLYYFVWKPLSPRIRARLREDKLESAAGVIFPEFADIVSKFDELASTRFITGIHRPIQSFQSFHSDSSRSPQQLQTDGARMHLMQVLSGNYHHVIDEPVSQLQSDIGRSLSRGSKRFLLSHFGSEFSNLLWTYKNFFVNSYVEACKSVGIESVPQSSREEYAKFVTKFNHFVSSYTDFAKKSNRMMGERTFGEYLEDATPLTM